MCPKQKTKSGNYAIEIGKGILLAVVFAVISAAVYGFLIWRGNVSEATGNVWTYATLMIAALIGNFVSSIRIGERYVIICGITSAVFAFLLLAVGVLFFDGNIQGLGGNLLAILIGGAIACVLTMKKANKKVKFKRRSR